MPNPKLPRSETTGVKPMTCEVGFMRQTLRGWVLRDRNQSREEDLDQLIAFEVRQALRAHGVEGDA